MIFSTTAAKFAYLFSAKTSRAPAELFLPFDIMPPTKIIAWAQFMPSISAIFFSVALFDANALHFASFSLHPARLPNSLLISLAFFKASATPSGVSLRLLILLSSMKPAVAVPASALTALFHTAINCKAWLIDQFGPCAYPFVLVLLVASTALPTLNRNFATLLSRCSASA